MVPNLFDDKTRTHYGPASRAETTYSFYDRSAQEWAGRIRNMLQRWVDRWPVEKRSPLVSRMRHRGRGSDAKQTSFLSSFFELYLHEFLQGTGGKVEVEPERFGRTPDFGVTEILSDGTERHYVLEAQSINIEGRLEPSTIENRVLDLLDEIQSYDFMLKVETRGSLASMPKTESIKKPFEQLLQEANYDVLRAMVDNDPQFIRAMPSTSIRQGGWTLKGTLLPVPPTSRGNRLKFIGMGPGYGGAVNDTIGPRDSLYVKAKRYQREPNLILAIRDDPIGISMQNVLFGSDAVTFFSHKDPMDTSPVPDPVLTQKADGFWVNSKGPINAHVIGVVAFKNLYPQSVDRVTAVYYSNPYTDKPKPSWAVAITHAEYEDGSIRIVDGLEPCTFTKDYEVIPQGDLFSTPTA